MIILFTFAFVNKFEISWHLQNNLLTKFDIFQLMISLWNLYILDVDMLNVDTFQIRGMAV